MWDLKHKVAVVTGASSGIGRSCALGLAARGASVALVDINEAGLEAVSREVTRLGRACSTHVADVADRDRMEALATEVLEAHGQVDIVLNNAGVTVAGTFEDHSLEDFDFVLGINLRGVIHGCHFFLPHLKARPRASLVNISSVFGLIGVPGQAAYCASKFAVRGLSETLRNELHGTGVHVTCVHPGGINTNIVKASRFVSQELDPERSARLFERFGMHPDDAARRIIDAIERGTPRLLITREAYLIDALKRLIPVPDPRIIQRIWRAMSPSKP